MPELPEVEITRRNLSDWMEGYQITGISVPDATVLQNSQTDELSDKTVGRRVKRISREGKYLLVHLERDDVVVFHLRMTGKFTLCEKPEPEYGRISLCVGKNKWVVLRDMRRLAKAWLLDKEDLDAFEPVAKLGPDALNVSAEMLAKRLPPRRMLKTALLDQQIIAGLGNIAGSELLWRAKLPPRRKCGDLTQQKLKELADIILRYLTEVIDREKASELTYIAEDSDQNSFDVYRRDGSNCPRCSETIVRRKIGGRSTYICPSCQGTTD